MSFQFTESPPSPPCHCVLLRPLSLPPEKDIHDYLNRDKLRYVLNIAKAFEPRVDNLGATFQMKVSFHAVIFELQTFRIFGIFLFKFEF